MDNQLQFDYYLMNKRLAEATRIAIIKQVNTFHQWVESESIPDVTEVSYNDIMAFIKHCSKDGNVQKTIALKLGFLNHYFLWLIKEGEMRENPVSNIVIQGIKRKKLHNHFKREQLDELYSNYLPMDLSGMRNKVIFGMVVYQALRVDEITNLTVKDVKFKEGKITIASGRKTNGRTLKLEPYQIVDLMEYMSDARQTLLWETEKDTDLLFITESESLYNTFQHILSQLKKQDKQVKDWKQLRASVISHWVTQNGLRKAQYLAGHKFISSTEEYKQQDLDELMAEINQFHPF